ncbi:MAG: hypothetical protein IPM24_20240 [Bryobacterales bacterium]|nr:hypothetical protein [Bryobacterales bacterium]
MRVSAVLCALLIAGAAWAAPKPPPSGSAENTLARIEATIFPGKDGVKQVAGDDLGGFYVAVQVTFTPKEEKHIRWDDFILRTDRDGERSTPFSASQIAGGSVLVVSQRYGGGGVAAEERGPVWGGMGGPMGGMGAPAGGFGNTGSSVTNEVAASSDDKGKENPLEAHLAKLMLPEGETDEPVTGYLFFTMEPKQKVKQLELLYKKGKQQLSVRFK